MNIFDIVLDSEDLLVLGPISNVELQTDIGPTGKRGSKFFVGSGDPNNFGVIPATEQIQIGDFFINSSTSSRYGWLYVYQVGQNNVISWVEAVRLQPSIYSNNIQIEFENGLASTSIPIADITSDNLIVNTDKYVVQLTPIIADPFIINLQQKRIPQPEYSQLVLDTRATRFLLGSWVPYTGLVTVGITISVI
jgi:hypothetical protein